MTRKEYESLRATIQNRGVARYNGRTAHDEAGLQFICKCENYKPGMAREAEKAEPEQKAEQKPEA